MCLLQTNMYSLESFDDSGSRLYVILSHVWNNPEKITFGRLPLDANGTGYGQQKIMKLCEIARKGHERCFEPVGHAWIDTCCINTSETREKAFTIHPMFKWDENANVCFAFLPNVRADGWSKYDEDVDRRRGCATFIEEEFLRSTWLAREWTLQGLRALHIVYLVYSMSISGLSTGKVFRMLSVDYNQS